MQDKLLQTPDGVRDTYDVECKRKERLLRSCIILWSYTAIMI